MTMQLSEILARIPAPAEEGQGIVTPTENAMGAFSRSIRRMGGAYFGLATHQNYTLMGSARSGIGFIVDRNRLSHSTNRLHRLLHRSIPTADEYLDFWEHRAGWQLDYLGRNPGSEGDMAMFERIIHEHGQEIDVSLFFDRKEASKDPKKASWLASEGDYDHVRQMFLDDRIILINADVQSPELFDAVAEICISYGMAVNVAYLSNVEDHLAGRIMGAGAGSVKELWQNLGKLTYGEKAKILRTVRTFGNISMDSTFHYVVQPMADFISKAYAGYDDLMADIRDQITERSYGVTCMPVPVDERDWFMADRGWDFP